MPITKRVVRRKTAETTEIPFSSTVPIKSVSSLTNTATKLIAEITDFRDQITSLEKSIAETKERWEKEQKEYVQEMHEQNQQEEIARKREEETYQYETKLTRKRAEDEFTERRAKWERELADQKEQLAKEHEELTTLRKQVAAFEEEKEKLVKTTSAAVQKELAAAFSTERKLREQEVKSEKDMQTLKLTTLTNDNQRLNQEITRLKQALDSANREVKDIAVKVIDSRRPLPSPEPQKQSSRE